MLFFAMPIQKFQVSTIEHNDVQVDHIRWECKNFHRAISTMIVAIVYHATTYRWLTFNWAIKITWIQVKLCYNIFFLAIHSVDADEN